MSYRHRVTPRFPLYPRQSFKMANWLFLALCGCSLSGCSTGAGLAPKPSPPIVVIERAVALSTVDYDEFVGRTEASETVEIRSRISGFLKTIDFADGQLVEKDQLLATVESDEYDAIQEQSESRTLLWQAKRDLAVATFERSKKLLDQNAISREEYEENAAAVKQSEAQVTAALADEKRTALDVKYTSIRAPLRGRIDRALLTPGNMLTGGLGSGTLITRIVKDSPMFAYIDVDERSILRYVRKAKQTANPTAELKSLEIPCELSLQDEEGYPHTGKLDFLENRVDTATGTIRLRGLFDNADGLLRGGLFVRVRIPVSDPYEAIQIPEMALGSAQGEDFVFVVDEQSNAVRRKVELGKLQGSLRIIKSGVAAGEQVIVQGIQRVRPGMTVQIKEASPVASHSVSAPATLATNATIRSEQ